jgi:hypothetical protein
MIRYLRQSTSSVLRLDTQSHLQAHPTFRPQSGLRVQALRPSEARHPRLLGGARRLAAAPKRVLIHLMGAIRGDAGVAGTEVRVSNEEERVVYLIFVHML